MEIKLKTYKKDFEYSYALGASPVIELLHNRPGDCFEIIFDPSYPDTGGKIKGLCEKYNIPIKTNQKLINILSPKENCYVTGAFFKRERTVETDKSHVVLDNPSDMGNIGAIMRSCAGFGTENLAIIGNGADAYNPRAIRASMGAFFHVNIQYFKSFGDYTELHGKNRGIYVFMPSGETELSKIDAQKEGVYSLIFGNESSGLDHKIYKNAGKSVFIRQTDKVDSLSLPVAVSVSLFWFSRR